MEFRKFNFAVFGLTLGLAASVALVNRAIDPFGLFHAAPDRPCTVYYNQRSSKYLLADRYIPEHFESLLVGTSVSVNWDTSRLRVLKLYNGSLDGGNATEALLITRRVLRQHPPRYLLVAAYPFLTASHGRNHPGSMVESEYWSVFGSHLVLLNYVGAAAVRLGLRKPTSNAFGWQEEQMLTDHPEPWFTPEQAEANFHLDPQALDDLRDLLEAARCAGTRIIGIIPPVAPALWANEHANFEAYYQRILPLFAAAPIIDFNAPAFAGLRQTPGAFPDGIHLSQAAADRLIQLLDDQLLRLGVAPGKSDPQVAKW